MKIKDSYERGLLLALLVSSLNLSVAQAESPTTDSVPIRIRMDQIAQSFRELERFLPSQERFSDSANEATISSALAKLSTSFYEVLQTSAHGHVKDPGFQVTLRVVSEMIDDAKNRFKEGKKGYALWRLRTTASHCVTCHTRYEVPTPLASQLAPEELADDFSKGEFYLATRQFEEAAKYFLKSARVPPPGRTRLDALRKWLVIQTRVWAEPARALDELRNFTSQYKLNSLELETVSQWSNSLSSWKNEKVVEVDALRKAESLIRQGLGSNDLLYGNVGAVELLRATALLHKMLEDESSKTRRGHALYLLGLTYSRLPLFFLDELPELLLEQAIREIPGSEDARLAYKLYTEVVSLGFTGSAGTEIPDDIQLKFKELYNLAYGIRGIEDRI